MPRKSRIKRARAHKAEMARHALYPMHATPPVADFSQNEAGTSEVSSSNDVDPELASFCQRFNLEPQVQHFGDDGDRDDAPSAHPDSDHDHSKVSDIVEESELDHFSAVLQRAQQIAIQLEKEKQHSRKRKTPKQYKGNSLKTISRHKRTKLQLAEKGFLGVFEFLNLPRPGGKRSGASEPSAQATTDLTQATSAKGHLIREEEEEEDSPEEDAVNVDMTMATVTAAGATSLQKPCQLM
ncbi:hypothetical protein EI94DRAFT_1701400 [Lactarius quietus]|nr:hypothetical protein EI94DRAFT_1701400 [Lactarius quietus]